MAYVGILSALGGLFMVLWVSYIIVRVKHNRMIRMISTLEWLALQSLQTRNDELGKSLEMVRDTWERTYSLFRSSFSKYISLVWNARFQELYLANRFGDELYNLSMSPIAPTKDFDEHPQVDHCTAIIARHVNDFNRLARLVLQKANNRQRSLNDEL